MHTWPSHTLWLCPPAGQAVATSRMAAQRSSCRRCHVSSHDRRRREAEPSLAYSSKRTFRIKPVSDMIPPQFKLRRDCYTFGTVPRKLQVHVEVGVGYSAELVEGDLGSDFAEDESAFVEDKHGVFGDDHVCLAYAGDGECALFDQFGLAVLAGMLHGYDDFSCSCHEVHRPADSKLFPVGDDPVGDVPFLVYFERADDGGVNVATPYHPEGCGAVHVDAARSLGNT